MLIKTIFGVILSSLIFIGCGTDSTGGKFTGTLSDETEIEVVEPIKPSEPTINIGVFLDSSVSGIKYKTTSKLEGRTNIIGEYKYNDGDLIEFFVGDVSLGEIEAKELITTDDLPYPIQVAQFLQTIDSDNFTENGIEIKELLHKNALLKKSRIKDDNSSLFAKRLNIKYFNDSEKNTIFIKKVMSTSEISYRKIVSTIIASKHQESAKRLQNIKNNNIQLYNDITSIEMNSTLDMNSSIKHTALKPRLIYSFYKNSYRENLKLQADIEEESEISDELTIEYKNNYLALTTMIIESLLYTESSTKDVKRKIIDNIKNISTQNSELLNATKECISTLSLSDDNRTKEANRIIDCMKTDIENGSTQFITESINSPIEAKERKVAIAYLDLYLSCNPQERQPLLKRFENNNTIDDRLWYATTYAEIYDDNTPSLYKGAKSIINDYIAKMSKLADDVSKGLPQDSFLNRDDSIEEIEKVSISAKPIKLESWEGSTILWTAIDIDNRTGADINITDFEPKIIEGDREISIPNSHLYTILEQSYARTNSAVNMLTPIFIDDESILKENNRLSIEIYYRANDDTFQTDSKTIVDFNLNELQSDKNINEFNKNRISLSKSMEIVEEKQKLYLPIVKLGLNILDKDSIKWATKPNDIEIKTDRDGQLYIYPSLKSENSYETNFFEVSNRLDPYSASTTFVLNIIRKETKNIRYREDKSFPITIEYIENNPYKKLASEECKTKKWRAWRNLKLALKDKISNQENIISSIQGCWDIQKLVEEEDFEYDRAVVNTIKDNRSIFR